LEYLNSDALVPLVPDATAATDTPVTEPVLDKDVLEEDDVVLPLPTHVTSVMSSNPSDWVDLHLITPTDPNGDAESSYLLSDDFLEPPSLD
jgi:hypothetical protein